MTETTAAASPGWTQIQEKVCALLVSIDLQKHEIANAKETASKEMQRLLIALLEVSDAFDRIFANIAPRLENADKQARIWVGNFRGVRKIFDGVMKQNGVSPIEAPEGKAVPGFHTVIDVREDLDKDDGTILEEIERGYLWNDTVLRKAKVIAVKN